MEEVMCMKLLNRSECYSRKKLGNNSELIQHQSNMTCADLNPQVIMMQPNSVFC